MLKFKIGDRIKNKHADQYSYANINNYTFKIIGIYNNKYELKANNFIGYRSIEEIENNFILIQ
jgi:hypothetical protein